MRERSNSIHFASHRGAEVSAIFHTIFSTCRMVGVSALDYLKQFFEAILAGRTDYNNLLPPNNRPEKQINLKVLREYFAVSVSDGAENGYFCRRRGNWTVANNYYKSQTI